MDQESDRVAGVSSRNVGSTRPRAGAFLLIGGCALLFFACWGLWHGIEWIAQPFYAYAWWAVIAILDGYCAIRRGTSLLTSRWRLAPAIGLWSITFWITFELLNLRFKNWYYVGVSVVDSTVGLVGAGIFTMACFSTVFFGLFEMQEALAASGLWRAWRGRPGKLPRWVGPALQVLGLTMAALAVAFPLYLAPLIWGSFTFLVDPWNYRRGSRSILRDVESGDWGAVARVFLSGCLCGLIWECLNFFAPQKWIYTVRGLEGLKLFEMPLLGFLGFPALALDAAAGFAFLSYHFLGNQCWEPPEDLSYAPTPRPRRSPVIFWATVPFQAVFWAVVGLNVAGSIGSIQVNLGDLELSPQEIQLLRASDIRNPRQLLLAGRAPGEAAALAERLGWSKDHLRKVLDQADLFTFKGLGSWNGRLLREVGVQRVEDLAREKPEDLARRLTAAARSRGIRPPRLDHVRVWVLASRDRGIVLIASPD